MQCEERGQAHFAMNRFEENNTENSGKGQKKLKKTY